MPVPEAARRRSPAGRRANSVSRIFRGEVTRWSELGGPDRPIRLFVRPAYSGTYDFFVVQTDVAGNTTERTVSALIDTTKPTDVTAITASRARLPRQPGPARANWLP